jgi:thiamine kinase-like enzyme
MDMVQRQALIEALTKAVTSIKKRGDEGEYIRLLSALKKQLPYHIKKVYPIRKEVYKVYTTTGVFILKGYSSFSRLKLQEAFTDSIKKEGFRKSYSFIKLDQEPIVYDNQYFGCLPFIEPHPTPFTFKTNSERLEGLKLLSEFHQVTKRTVKGYQTLIPEYNLRKKWKERLKKFKDNKKVLHKYLPTDVINEWIQWGEWSLNGIKQHEHNMVDEQVILHGDVAHHNYLRKKDGTLYLIDFDLISIGSKQLDLLQYSNRILPSIDWNLDALLQYKDLYQLTQNPGYLHALVYPTDLFREWNRLIKEGSDRNHKKVQSMLNQSLSQLHLRQDFTSKIINHISK